MFKRGTFAVVCKCSDTSEIMAIAMSPLRLIVGYSDGYFEENKNGMPPRIALSAKLSLMREPIKESLGIYPRINENIKKGNYEVVSDFYKIIGIDDMAFFYRKLDEIFDLEQEEYDEFYEIPIKME